MIRRWLPLLAATLLCVLAPSARACNVPVFRYALERWHPDPYELILFHRGPLDEAHTALVERLDKTTSGKNAPTNLEITPVDLDDSPGRAMQDLWDSQRAPRLPWLVLRLPKSAKQQEVIWTGRLDQANIDTVVQSPLRRKIAERLLEGDTAVWVLLESGDREKDTAAAKMLETQLKKMTDTLKLPELDKDDPKDLIEIGPGAPPLKVAFSLIRLARKDKTEALLVRMLLNTEDDLHTYEEPMAFPVFGRGRSLYALVGKGINADTIEDACKFAVGPCSCEVKQLNPGLDLLMTERWTAKLKGNKTAEDTLPPFIGGATICVEAPPLDPLSLDSVPPMPTSPLVLGTLFVLGLAFGVALLGTLFLVRRNKAV